MTQTNTKLASPFNPARKPFMPNKKFEFDPAQLSDQVKESAQQIWLAGLGAFAKNQDEGKKVFNKLVEDGLNLQKKTSETLHAKVSEATDKLNAMATNLGQTTPTQHWAPLEDLFHNRVAKALEKLEVPSAAELEALEIRVAQLEKLLKASGAHSPAAKKTAATKSTRAKSSSAK